MAKLVSDNYKVKRKECDIEVELMSAEIET
jgi:hypothetical protein